jgi:hypothetical protein
MYEELPHAVNEVARYWVDIHIPTSLEELPLLPPAAPFDYDCVVVAIAHSSVVLNRWNFKQLVPGFSVKTIQLANLDGVVFGDAGALKDIAMGLYKKIYDKPDTPETKRQKVNPEPKTPEFILEEYIIDAQQDAAASETTKERIDVNLGLRHFFRNRGNASRRYNMFYNKRFTFSSWGSDVGCVLLFTPAGIEELFKEHIDASRAQVAKGLPPNTLTKDEILYEVYKKGFRKPLFLDSGCATMRKADDPLDDMTIDEYARIGALGGKRTRRKRKSRRK